MIENTFNVLYSDYKPGPRRQLLCKRRQQCPPTHMRDGNKEIGKKGGKKVGGKQEKIEELTVPLYNRCLIAMDRDT